MSGLLGSIDLHLNVPRFGFVYEVGHVAGDEIKSAQDPDFGLNTLDRQGANSAHEISTRPYRQMQPRFPDLGDDTQIAVLAVHPDNSGGARKGLSRQVGPDHIQSRRQLEMGQASIHGQGNCGQEVRT